MHILLGSCDVIQPKFGCPPWLLNICNFFWLSMRQFAWFNIGLHLIFIWCQVAVRFNGQQWVLAVEFTKCFTKFIISIVLF